MQFETTLQHIRISNLKGLSQILLLGLMNSGISSDLIVGWVFQNLLTVFGLLLDSSLAQTFAF